MARQIIFRQGPDGNTCTIGPSSSSGMSEEDVIRLVDDEILKIMCRIDVLFRDMKYLEGEIRRLDGIMTRMEKLFSNYIKAKEELMKHE